MSNPADTLNQRYEIGVKVAWIGLGTIDYEKDTIDFDARAAAMFDLPADAPL